MYYKNRLGTEKKRKRTIYCAMCRDCIKPNEVTFVATGFGFSKRICYNCIRDIHLDMFVTKYKFSAYVEWIYRNIIIKLNMLLFKLRK